MRHASLELIGAIMGVAPITGHGGEWGRSVCSCDQVRWGATAWAMGEPSPDGRAPVAGRPWDPTCEDTRTVDCPECLAVVASARGPERTAELMVYADALWERLEAIRQRAERQRTWRRPNTARRFRIVMAYAAKMNLIRAAVPVVPGVAA